MGVVVVVVEVKMLLLVLRCGGSGVGGAVDVCVAGDSFSGGGLVVGWWRLSVGGGNSGVAGVVCI